MRLNPLHPSDYHITSGNALYFTGRYGDAVREFRQRGETVPINLANLSAAYGQLGQLEEARHYAKRFVDVRRKQLKADDEAVPASELELAAPKLRRFRRQVDRDRFLDGLRKAGLSE